MNTFNHQINSRVLSTFSSIAQELELNPQKNYLFDLSYLAALSIEGDKAIEFLQGQLTADIAKVTDIQMIQTAQCNLKGRILALMDVICWHGMKLILPQDILEQTKNALSKVAMLSRVIIKEANNFDIFGFYLQNQKDIVPLSLYFPKDLYAKAEGESFCYYHLGNGFYIIVADKNNVARLINPFIEKNQMAGSLTWHTLRLQQQELSVYPESRGMFLPHRLDLHKTPYLSFDKGCYKGQEIIARTHYKATLKHELRTYIITTESELISGQKLYRVENDIELGELVDYSYLDTNKYLIAVSILKDAPLKVRLEKNQYEIMLLHP